MKQVLFCILSLTTVNAPLFCMETTKLHVIAEQLRKKDQTSSCCGSCHCQARYELLQHSWLWCCGSSAKLREAHLLEEEKRSYFTRFCLGALSLLCGCCGSSAKLEAWHNNN